MDDDCNHEVKRHLLLGRKAMTNWQHIKSRDITLPKVGSYSQSYGFSNSNVDVRVGPQRRLSVEELMLLNCGAGEVSWQFLGDQGDQINQL